MSDVETVVIMAGERGPSYDGVMLTYGDGPGMIRLSRKKAKGGFHFTSAVTLDEPARLALIASLMTVGEMSEIAAHPSRFTLGLADALAERAVMLGEPDAA